MSDTTDKTIGTAEYLLDNLDPDCPCGKAQGAAYVSHQAIILARQVEAVQALADDYDLWYQHAMDDGDVSLAIDYEHTASLIRKALSPEGL